MFENASQMNFHRNSIFKKITGNYFWMEFVAPGFEIWTISRWIKWEEEVKIVANDLLIIDEWHSNNKILEKQRFT